MRRTSPRTYADGHDDVLGRARALGARIVHEIVDQTDYASRDFTIADPDGNHWTFATFAG